MKKNEKRPNRLKNTAISFPVEKPEPITVPKIKNTTKSTAFIFQKYATKNVFILNLISK